MIFSGIITLLYNIFSFILSFFPDADTAVSSLISSSIYNAKLQLVNYNWIFPVDMFYILLNASLILLGFLLLFRIIRWIASILSANLFH